MGNNLNSVASGQGEPDLQVAFKSAMRRFAATVRTRFSSARSMPCACTAMFDR
jgi:hypothetical protein